MYWYKLYGKNVMSEFELYQCVTIDPLTKEEADIIITNENLPEEVLNSLPKDTMLASKIDRKFTYFTNTWGLFGIRDGKYITAYKREGATEENLHPFILGYAIAFLFWQNNMHSIHCSCIRINGKALLFSGVSGSGKSTLTTKFLDEQNASLISDDVVVVNIEDGKLLAYPAFPQQKLCRDAVQRNGRNEDDLRYIDETKDKFALNRSEGFLLEPAECLGMVVLDHTDKVTNVEYEAIKGNDKISAVYTNWFLFPAMRELSTDIIDFQRSLRIASKLDILHITRPDNVDSTSDQIRIINDFFKLGLDL